MTAPATVTATCKCGRVGACSTCCCINAAHRAQPPRECSLCKHTGSIQKVGA